MYWQVYLHKTSLVAEQLMIRALQRAKELTLKGETLIASKALLYFLKNEITHDTFNDFTLETYANLDDFDIISAMKEWQFHDDFVLSNLCQMIINRDLLKIEIKNDQINNDKLNKHITNLMHKYNVTNYEASFFVFKGEVTNQAYQLNSQNINILFKNGKVTDIVKASDHLNLKVLSKPVTKYYICYPKDKL
ncbi:MAG: hypothetical protein IIB83_09465 [Bacteroidetes bacterium]|nr:hypothetical protein [Bacteroidota bacterium]